LLGHRLYAVTDAQHGNTELEHRLRSTRRSRICYGLRPAGEDDSLGLERTDFFVGDVPGKNLGVDAHFAHTPRDQLRVLRAEIQYQDPVGVYIPGRASRMRLRGSSHRTRHAVHVLTHDTL